MESLKSFASKIFFRESQELIPASYREHDVCVCGKEISPDISEPVLILSCKHFFHLDCIENYYQTANPCCPLCVESMSSQGKGSDHSESQELEDGGNVDVVRPLTPMSLERLESDVAYELEPAIEKDIGSTQESSDFQASSQELDEQVSLVGVSENEETESSQRISTPQENIEVRPSSSTFTSHRQKSIEGLLRELIAPSDEIELSVVSEEPQGDTSVGENLARLYRLASAAEDRVVLSNQDEMRGWYKYGEEFENRVSEVSRSKGITDKTARSHVYKEIMPHLSGIKQGNLRTKTHKARNIYRLFKEIGVDKIRSVKSYSADFVSSLTVAQIDSIMRDVLNV
jgi:hypothetical protein